jgi:hypothetical protein
VPGWTIARRRGPHVAGQADVHLIAEICHGGPYDCPDRMTAPVPVLLVTGPVGVGKTVVAGEAARLLSKAGIPHAMADLAVIGACWPPPADDRWNVLCRVLEARSLLGRVAEAVPGADITVVRLRAPLDLVRTRIVAREAGRDPQWYLDTATYLFDRLEHAGVEDHVVDNDNRPVAQVAADVLHAAGWPGTRPADRG